MTKYLILALVLLASCKTSKVKPSTPVNPTEQEPCLLDVWIMTSKGAVLDKTVPCDFYSKSRQAEESSEAEKIILLKHIK